MPAAWRRLHPNQGRGLSLRRNLGWQLLALYLLFIGPVLVGALLFAGVARRDLENDVVKADLALARAVALETDALLANAAQTVARLAAQPGVAALDLTTMRGIFQDIGLARGDIDLVYRLDANGIMRYHYPEGPTSTVGVDFSFREYFQDARRSAGPFFSAGRISPTTGKPVVTAVAALHNTAGAFSGVVATNLALDSLSETLAVIVGEASSGLIVSIVDARGQVIAHPGLLSPDLVSDSLLTVRQGEDMGLPENLLPDWGQWNDGVVARVLQGETGSTLSQAPDQSQWLRSFVPVPVAGWGVIVQRPADAAFATSTRFQRLLRAATVIFLIGGALFWLALSRQVILPLERLTEFSQELGKRGRPGVITPAQSPPGADRSDQVGHLARTLATMSQNIEQRFVELSTLLETSRSVVRSLDTSEVIKSILDEVHRLLNVDRSAIVALDQRLGVFRISASRGLSEHYVEQLRIEPSEPQSATMRALRTQAPVQIPDTLLEDEFPTLRARSQVEGFRSLLVLPLLTQHAPPAALLLYNAQPHRYTAAEVELVSNFANHAAMAMEHAALYARSDERLQEQTRRLEAIVESLNDGVILESLTGKVLFCNQSAANFLGIRRAVARTRNAAELQQTLLSTAEAPAQAEAALRAAIEGAGPATVDLSRRAPDGRNQDLRIEVFRVTDAQGELIGRGQFWQDITHDKDLDRMKSALLSTVSHELRTPLAAIKGYATTLLAQDVQWDAEAQHEFIQTISAEADRLAALVSNLLDLSRLEGGALRIQRDLYPVADLIQEAVQHNRAIVGDRLRLLLDPDLPALWLDRPRMETVLRNLLENAAKYAPTETPIELSAQRRNGQVIVTVRDYGPGVPAGQSERIFDRFFRADADRTRRVGGAGLGLAICRGFVEAHGGRIWVEDAQPGAQFTFSLPVEIRKPGEQ